MYKPILIAAACLALLVIGYALVAYAASTDLGEKKVSIIIESGDPFSGVADDLIENGVVTNRLALKLAARLREIDRKLTPGRYDFTGKNSPRSVLTKLENADFVIIRVTVYEGAPIWEVASLLSEKMEVDSAEIMALNTDPRFLSDLKVPSLEGYLFPETYFFPWGTKSRRMLTDMVLMFRKQTETLWPDSLSGILSREQIVILASIVEAEALLDAEKPVIASVYHNRLRKRMKLDADPTVIYGLGGLDRSLTRGDLNRDTPYNTYLRRGLPPTPINSPGLAALRAALHPDKTDYLFFVADGTGRHVFSRTNAEHNRARREIRRAQQSGS